MSEAITRTPRIYLQRLDKENVTFKLRNTNENTPHYIPQAMTLK